MPTKVEWRDGAVPMETDTSVELRGRAIITAADLVQSLGSRRAGTRGSAIRLVMVPRSRIANPEGYHLRAAGKRVVIEASDPRGLFYGMQTLRQLAIGASGRRSIPAVDIQDAPRFRWRGLLIDLGRHFFGKPT